MEVLRRERVVKGESAGMNDGLSKWKTKAIGHAKASGFLPWLTAQSHFKRNFSSSRENFSSFIKKMAR